MPAQIEVEGLTELRSLLRRLDDNTLKKSLKDAHKDVSKLVVDQALPHVPVGPTGRLKASVRAAGSQREAQVLAGTARVNYAAAIHWGRGSGNVNFKHGRKAGAQRGGPIKGRPFLWDAAQAVMSQAHDVYLSQMSRLFDKVRSR